MDQANSFSLKTMNIEADRGSIYASDGRLLASSVPYYEIHFDARCENLTDRMFRQKVDSLSWCLSRLFGDKSAEVRQLIRQNKLRFHNPDKRQIAEVLRYYENLKQSGD